jgi:iron complex outermembrane receptor protein
MGESSIHYKLAHQRRGRPHASTSGAASVDLAVRHVAALPKPAVPAYTAFDARFAWRPHPALELSVAGQNLFGTDHVEFGAAPTASVVPRSVSFALAWKL